MSDNLKKFIQLAKESVIDEDEPYKTEAFKIILNHYITTNSTDLSHHPDPSKNKTQNNSNLDAKLKLLADKCNLNSHQINDVFSIKENSVEIICPIIGSDAYKHVVVSLGVLAAYELILDCDWVSSSTLAECLRSAGVKDLANFSSTLKKYHKYFRSRGTTKSKEYKLTSTDGRSKSYEVIKKLFNGEEIQFE